MVRNFPQEMITFVRMKTTGQIRRIFLIGYMGAGKTTLGKALSRQMNLSFIDTDHFIEEHYHQTIRRIFEEKGEDGFREIERKTLREVSEFEDAVISTGGGTPCFHGNMAFMNMAGTTVYLKLSVDEIVKRTEPCRDTRPVLKNRSGEELRQYIAASLSERSRYYEQADIVLPVDTVNTGADTNVLITRLEKMLFP
ncbi:MAG: shikimate kinase [Tannerella sp.]|jgi:shikimate kinase|nr:shikimate kinase [Tannerella sp.]